jgi:DNA repair exonuclease SbcCD ATPase subunit
MRTKAWVWILALAVPLAAGSCVRVYKTAKVRKSLVKAQRGVGDMIGDAQKLRAELRRDTERLQRQRPDLAPAVAAELQPDIEAIDAALADIRQAAKRLAALRAEFDTIAGGRKKIREDQPAFERVERLRRDYQALAAETHRRAKALVQAARDAKKKLNRLSLAARSGD